MLHEILLSLSGHPSPLLQQAAADATGPNDSSSSESLLTASGKLVSPPERALLSSLARLSDLHVKIKSFAHQISASHPSVICRAVATAVDATHLAAFQRKVLEVEDGILRGDAAFVGAYNIVPLTVIVTEFGGWTRRMEWLWEVVQFMLTRGPSGMIPDGSRGSGGQLEEAAAASFCTGARLIDRLRGELQTGFRDIEETARSLVAVAEVAWLKQVSAWVLYGKIPSFGAGDFFVQQEKKAEKGQDDDGEPSSADEFVCVPALLPSFVTPATAASMLFIGRSLNQIRAKSAAGDYSSLRGGTDHLSTQLTQLSKLKHPVDSATFSRTVTEIRHFLSRTLLQRLLPLSKVLEALQLLRDFFLLRRGEFAMALTQQADEKIRSRWKRVENMAAYDKSKGRGGKDGGLGAVIVKEGEVTAVLARTWAAMGSMQGEHADEDEGLELARDLIRLTLAKSSLSKSAATVAPSTPTVGAGERGSSLSLIAPTPFRNLLFSVPTILTLQIPSPLDLFLSPSDLQTYTAINSYLLALRRAHLRLTDLWKITSLRRHHPAPPGPPYGSSRGGRERVKLLNKRYADRSKTLRNAWATASAAIFFLGETEGYFQSEVVEGLSEGFYAWLDGGAQHQQHGVNSRRSSRPTSRRNTTTSAGDRRSRDGDEMDIDTDPDQDQDQDDIWLRESPNTTTTSQLPNNRTQPQESTSSRDPQTLATAHRSYLRALVRRLLLSQPSFTNPLYELLVQIDRLASLVRRIHEVWAASDLEADAGVVDAFVNLEREERDVTEELREVEEHVKRGIEGVVSELRRLEGGGELVYGADGEAEEGVGDDGESDEGSGGGGGMFSGRYVPRRVGGVDRLLMKLDFGGWFGRSSAGGGAESEGEMGFGAGAGAGDDDL